jgi:hypothetical protein
MAESSSSSSTGTLVFQGVIAILGLVGLYYLYTYLFVSTEAAPSVLLSGKQNANTVGPIKIGANALPPLFTGGEFTISTWINVTNINTVAPGKPKSILRIGSNTFDTIRIYLNGQGAQLMIRFDTGTPHTLTAPTAANNFFNRDGAFQTMSPDTMQTAAGILQTPSQNACDILQIDMQRWIQVVICVKGMSCDVYMDGKLARSCVCPGIPTIESGKNSLTLCKTGVTFGGLISTTNNFSFSCTCAITFSKSSLFP